MTLQNGSNNPPRNYHFSYKVLRPSHDLAALSRRWNIAVEQLQTCLDEERRVEAAEFASWDRYWPSHDLPTILSRITLNIGSGIEAVIRLRRFSKKDATSADAQALSRDFKSMLRCCFYAKAMTAFSEYYGMSLLELRKTNICCIAKWSFGQKQLDPRRNRQFPSLTYSSKHHYESNHLLGCQWLRRTCSDLSQLVNGSQALQFRISNPPALWSHAQEDVDLRRFIANWNKARVTISHFFEKLPLPLPAFFSSLENEDLQALIMREQIETIFGTFQGVVEVESIKELDATNEQADGKIRVRSAPLTKVRIGQLLAPGAYDKSSQAAAAREFAKRQMKDTKNFPFEKQGAKFIVDMSRLPGYQPNEKANGSNRNLTHSNGT